MIQKIWSESRADAAAWDKRAVATSATASEDAATTKQGRQDGNGHKRSQKSRD